MAFSYWKVYLKLNIKDVGDVIGVYELSNSSWDMSKMKYIGHGKLRTELLRYLKEPYTSTSTYFRYEALYSNQRAQERERALLREFKKKYGRLPECNERID